MLCTGLTEQPRQDKVLLYRHNEPKKKPRKDPMSNVLHESPFTMVSKSGTSHHSSFLSACGMDFGETFKKKGRKWWGATEVNSEKNAWQGHELIEEIASE